MIFDITIGIKDIVSRIEKQGLHPSYKGDATLTICGFSPLSNLENNTVAWIKDLAKFDIESIDDGLNILFITNQKYTGEKNLNVISCENPKSGYFSLLDEYFTEKVTRSIATTSTILTDNIGENVNVGHNCFIDKNVSIGNGTIIRNNVVIEGSVIIGDDCVIESGTVIGAMGFGYYKDNDNIQQKVPDFGGVIIGDRVDVGANTTICRGTLVETIIGDDAKIDNLCHIAHNVKIGSRCLVVAMCEISGSTEISDDVYLAPCVSIINKIKIGKDSFVGVGAVVTKDVEANKVVIGVPAKVLRNNK